MKKIICIYPEDATTNFLLPIYKQLELLPNFNGYRFDTTDSSEKENLNDALCQLDDCSFVCFLGHGASNRLYGSVDNNGDKLELFNKTNTEYLKTINFVGVACRSKEFSENHLSKYIGFGDITSDYSEIEAERNLGDPNYMDWATEDDLINFQKEFAKAIANAVKLSQCKDLLSLFKMIKLCFNKQIAELLMQKTIPNYRHIADMLFDILNDFEYFYKE